MCSNRRGDRQCVPTDRETDNVFQQTYSEAVLLVVLMQFPGHPQLSAQLRVHLHGSPQPARVHVRLPTQRLSYCPHNATVTAHTTPQLLPTQSHRYCPHSATVTAHTTPQSLPTERHSYCPHSTTVTAHTEPQVLPTQYHSYCPHNATVTAHITAQLLPTQYHS